MQSSRFNFDVNNKVNGSDEDLDRQPSPPAVIAEPEDLDVILRRQESQEHCHDRKGMADQGLGDGAPKGSKVINDW